MDPAIATGLLRVAVIGDGTAADLALPTKVPVRELIPAIRHILDGGDDDDDNVAADGAVSAYSLRPLAGTPFSLDATLDTMAVKDGAELLLCKLPPGPPAPPVVEDIADAAAIHSAQQTTVFDPDTMVGRVALNANLVLAALTCGLAGYGWTLGYRLWAQAALGVVALLCVVGTVALRWHGRAVGADLLGAATVVPLGLGLIAALPGEAAAPRLVLAAAGVFGWSLLVLIATNRWVAFHTATVVTSVCAGVCATTRMLFELPYLTVGCGMLTVALILAVQAPTIAPVLARFPVFYVPAPGEPIPSHLPLRAMEDLPRRAALSQSFQAGLIGGSVVLTVAGSVLVAWLPARPSLLAWWLIVAVGLVTVLRIRLFGAAVPSLWFLSSPLLTTAELTVSFAATGHLEATLWAGSATVGLTAALTAMALARPGALAIPRRGYLDIIENVLLYTILPTVLWLVGLISLVRNRSPL
ncbi:MAG TPA: type VII secretion integral membrane protein EccD [Mycolicibacillus parakoreensis]|nr:type VII secretion integral membrane protein EccD [Mycolicibacillus parakoreensis]